MFVSEPALPVAADEFEIRNLLARLAQLTDSGDLDNYLTLLTDNVVWQLRAPSGDGHTQVRRSGRDQVAAGVRERTEQGLQGSGSATMHLVSTIEVRFESADHATASSHFVYLTQTTTTPQVTMVGRYRDRLVRGDDGWRLAERHATVG